jgi:hypothetical protein
MILLIAFIFAVFFLVHKDRNDWPKFIMKAILFAFYLISGMNFVTLQSRKVTRTGVGLREHDGGAQCLRRRQWGCFGFDSIRHWTVSTSGVVGLPVNLGLRTISWQQLLCTRCVVCKAHYLNPRRQGCVADEYPSSL